MGDPPTGGLEDSEGVLLRYRTVADLLDSTNVVDDIEYSVVCLVATEEPSLVEEALNHDSWGEAVKVEMKAIEDSRTCYESRDEGN
jgi:hypothetical protein